MAKRIEPGFDKPARAPRRKTAAKKAKRKSPAKSATKTRQRSWKMRAARFTAYWSAVLGLWGGIAVVGIFAFYGAKLPSADTWVVPERPPNMKIIAADGTFLANRGITGGQALGLEDMSPYIPQAVIAIEDHRFHSHFGFDPIGFARAMAINVSKGRMRQGGSTLTQQLAKNLFLTPERNFGRKVQELILAFWLETKYSKAEILELYLNRVYFGAGATGVDAAARRYFGKSARDVTVGEAALLAGLLKAPSRYTPAKDPDLARARAKTVLAAMRREGYVKDGDETLEEARPGQNARHFRSGPEHFIADMVAERVRKLSLGKASDLVVETTIDPFMLAAAQEAVAGTIVEHGEARNVGAGALVSMSPNGAIRALVGGHDYGASQYDRATNARRQPGSAFKSFVYLAAMEAGYAPDNIADDSAVRYRNWAPENYDKRYRGAVTLRESFADSLNTVAARLVMEVGPRRVADTAKTLGIASPLDANASIALGTSEVTLLELTAAHAPFANGGAAIVPHVISRISDGSGGVPYERRNPAPRPVMSPMALASMNDLFAATITSGTGKAARIDRPAGGKTGTTQGFRDALFTGFTADLVTTVWFGNDDNAPMKKVTGGSLPARAWQRYMRDAHAGLPIRAIPGAVAVARLPETVPQPTFRPAEEQGRVAALRDRVKNVLKKRAKSEAKRSIFDLISGR